MGVFRAQNLRRSPYGERGLKSIPDVIRKAIDASLPVWGAWIEILRMKTKYVFYNVAPRMGSVD